MPLRPLERADLTDQIISTLIAQIRRGEYPPGSRLPSQAELCKQLGVGRSSLREAVKVLGSLGVLEIRNGEGTFVSSGDWVFYPKPLEWGLSLQRRQIQNLIEVRVCLEEGIARAAARCIGNRELESLWDLLEQMRQTHEPSTLVELDLEFHLRIAEASQNNVFVHLIKVLRALMKDLMTKTLSLRSEQQQVWEEHARILDALALRNGEEAARAMVVHLEASVRRFEAANEPGNGYAH